MLPKSILIINNSGIVKNENAFYLYKNTSDFINSIAMCNDFENVGTMQLSLKTTDNNLITQKELNENSISIFTSKYSNKSNLHKVLSYLKSFKLATRIIHRFEFIYVFFPGHFSTISLLISLLYRKRYALYIRNEFKISYLTKIIFKNAEFIIATGETTKHKVSTYNKNCELIRPMVDFDINQIVTKKKQNVNNEFKILFVSRIEKKKGIFELIDAFYLFQQQFPHVSLDIVGSGPAIKQVEEKIIEYGIAEKCHTHGYINDFNQLKQYYLNANIFVFPTQYPEGFPRVIYEAMALNCPILTTFVGDIGSILRPNVNCIKLETPLKSSILENLVKAINEDTLLSKLSEKAKDDINDIFKNRKLSHHEHLLKLIKEKKHENSKSLEL